MPLHRILSGLRVLVVDDLADQREVVALLLERLGADVVTAASAGEALDALQSARPDVLLSDLMMPGEDGVDLIRRVRSLPPERGGDTPAAALTAYPDGSERTLAAGFQMVGSKPVTINELATIVAALARKHPHEPSDWTPERRVAAGVRDHVEALDWGEPLLEVEVSDARVALDLGRSRWQVRATTASRFFNFDVVTDAAGFIESVNRADDSGARCA